MLDLFSRFLDWISEFLAPRKGLLPILGILLILLNLILQFFLVGGLLVDSNLFLQDPYKLEREQTLIAQFLDWDWKIGIDFGCGTGANFWLFDRPNQTKRLLIGIDPDNGRIKEARKTAKKRLQKIKSCIVCGDIELLENAPNGLVADAIKEGQAKAEK